MLTRKETWLKLSEIGLVQGDMPSERWELIGSFLREVDLSRADLSRSNLRGSFLRGANLVEANLGGADLSGTDLFRADLSGAYLLGADLRGANLSRADLSKANLIGADLSGSDLSRAYLIGSDLSEAHLRGAHLYRADLSKANLIGADLLEATLLEADLSEARLIGADLRGADLSKTIFLKADISDANLKRSRMVDVNFRSANLSGSDITGATYWGVSNTGWKIDGIRAEYIYFTLNSLEKERHKRSFAKGQFETLFKSLPIVELIFKVYLTPAEFCILYGIIEDVKEQNPELGLGILEISGNDFQTRIAIKTKKDEFLIRAAHSIKERIEKGISSKQLLPHVVKVLTDITQVQEFPDLISYCERKIPPEINISVTDPIIILIHADGYTSNYID
jgi:uncharacterized protein YjbI with pentapeptide repeats